MSHRQRPQRLGGHLPLLSQHRQLTPAAGDDLTSDADVVAEVDEALPRLQPLRPDPVQGEHRLQLGAVAVPQGREAELAGVAYEDHPAGDRYLVAGRGVGRQVGVARPDLRQGGGAGEADRVGLDALGEHPVPLLPADLHLLGKVVGGVHWHGVLLAHGTLPRHGDTGVRPERTQAVRRLLRDNLPVMVDHTHALSFGAAAGDYDRFRPRYPEAAVRWALDGLSRARVVDLAAGTGILTRTVLALGHEVVPVEPDPGMRAQLVVSTPGTTALAGSAEALPLPDSAADAVLVGTAYHWFDREPAHAEIARVLRARWHLRPHLEHSGRQRRLGGRAGSHRPLRRQVGQRGRSTTTPTSGPPSTPSSSTNSATTPRSRRTSCAAWSAPVRTGSPPPRTISSGSSGN